MQHHVTAPSNGAETKFNPRAQVTGLPVYTVMKNNVLLRFDSLTHGDLVITDFSVQSVTDKTSNLSLIHI